MKQIAAVKIGDIFFGSQSYGGSHGSSLPLQELSGVTKVVSLFLRGSFAVAGIILLFYFLIGGIAMIGSAGKNDPKAQEQAKATLTSAVTGFVVVFTAYWIVKLLGNLFGIQNII